MASKRIKFTTAALLAAAVLIFNFYVTRRDQVIPIDHGEIYTKGPCTVVIRHDGKVVANKRVLFSREFEPCVAGSPYRDCSLVREADIDMDSNYVVVSNGPNHMLVRVARLGVNDISFHTCVSGVGCSSGEYFVGEHDAHLRHNIDVIIAPDDYKAPVS